MLSVVGMATFRNCLEIRSVVGSKRFSQGGPESLMTLGDVGIEDNTLLVVHAET